MWQSSYRYQFRSLVVSFRFKMGVFNCQRSLGHAEQHNIVRFWGNIDRVSFALGYCLKIGIRFWRKQGNISLSTLSLNNEVLLFSLKTNRHWPLWLAAVLTKAVLKVFVVQLCWVFDTECPMGSVFVWLLCFVATASIALSKTPQLQLQVQTQCLCKKKKKEFACSLPCRTRAVLGFWRSL